MTESKAIEVFKERLTLIKKHYAGEVKDYEEALEIGIEALEKQIPKKPIRHTAWEDFKCPACGSTEIRQYDTEYREYDKDCKFGYCSDCGQKLDWSDEE